MEAGLMLRIKPECIPCNISIIIRASRYATSDPDKQRDPEESFKQTNQLDMGGKSHGYFRGPSGNS
jgi:hypothetical protein